MSETRRGFYPEGRVKSSRRGFLGAAAAAVGVAAAGVAGGDITYNEYNASQPNQEIAILYNSYKPGSPEAAKQTAFILKLEQQASELAPSIHTPALKTEAEQGLASHPSKPEINKTVVARAALALAELQFGAKGRKAILKEIKKRGLYVGFEGSSDTDQKEGQERLVLTLAKEMEAANVHYVGQASSASVDDFQALQAISDLVYKLGRKLLPEHVDQNSLAGQIADAGIIAGASIAAGGASEAMPRRAFLGRTFAALGAAAAGGATEAKNLGGKAIEAVDSLRSGPNLGTGYDQPDPQVKPFLNSEYVRQKIQGHLITQVPA